jgi:putative CocE/NonD family hydrolase
MSLRIFSSVLCALLAGTQLASLSAVAQVNLAVTPVAAPAARVSRVGHYEGYSPELYSERVTSSEYIKVRDGVRLAVTLHRPARNGKPVDTPYPVIFTFTPYNSRFVSRNWPDEVDDPRAPGLRPMLDLTNFGYVVAEVDVRGKGSSFGVRSAFNDENEARDGYDMVEWLARQPWSTGKVGMYGCSYVGSTQWATARMAPPHLRAIFPEAANFDNYRLVRNGGISGQFNTRYQAPGVDEQGTLPVDGDKNGTLLAQALKQHEANGQMLDMVRGLPYRDSHDPATDIQYWLMASPYANAAAIERSGIAIYHQGNWLDEPGDQALIGYATMKNNPRKLLMGGGRHCDVGTIDTFAEHHRFYDRYLKDIDNGIDREPPVYYRTNGAPSGDEWDQAQSWPPTGVRSELWHLNGLRSGTVVSVYDGTLGKSATPTKKLPYQVNYDVGCVVDPEFRTESSDNRPGQKGEPQPGYWPCVLDKVGLTFTSAPLKDDMHIAGAPVIKVALRAIDPDFNLFAYLEQVDQDGRVRIFSHARLRASARKLSTPPYDNLGLPWHSNATTDVKPLEPGEETDLILTLSSTSTLIPAGSRLRITLTGADLRERDLPEIKAAMGQPRFEVLAGLGGSTIEIPTLPSRWQVAAKGKTGR